MRRQVGHSILTSIHRCRHLLWKKWLHGVSMRDAGRPTCGQQWYFCQSQNLIGEVCLFLFHVGCEATHVLQRNTVARSGMRGCCQISISVRVLAAPLASPSAPF